MPDSSVIEEHEKAGRYFDTNGVRSFVLEAGEGEAVLCIHGVPASCFLYRKVLRELAGHKLRGVAFDLIGLGLADRPSNFDYSWTGLGTFCDQAVEALGLSRFHLVVHDIGGPIGFELAAKKPERVMSLTILNTLIDVETFKKPWVMAPFAVPGLGSAWLASIQKPLFRVLMHQQGIHDRRAVPNAELDAYVELLKRKDGGRAFLKIMRGFETTARKQALYRSVVRDVDYPVQVIWGEHDPALRVDRYGELAKNATGVALQRLPGKHFLQEDQAPQIAERIATLARSNEP